MPVVPHNSSPEEDAEAQKATMQIQERKVQWIPHLCQEIPKI